MSQGSIEGRAATTPRLNGMVFTQDTTKTGRDCKSTQSSHEQQGND